MPFHKLTALSCAPPPGSPLRFAEVPLCDVPAPLSAYLQNLKQAPVAASAVLCWRVNDDPPHVRSECPFDLAVLLHTEVYWASTRATVFEQAFLLKAIKGLQIERPPLLAEALAVDTVAVTLLTPSGTTLMLCGANFAEQLRAATARAQQATKAKSQKPTI